MPFIDVRVTVPVDDGTKESIKSDLGLAVGAIHKSETYLMVGISDSQVLWLGGRKLDRGAYVAVSLYGNAASSDYDKLTGQICGILNSRLDIPGSSVYVSYHPVNDWGWNGRNF